MSNSVTVVQEPIEITYEKAQASQSLPATVELEKQYEVTLTTQQKIDTLKSMIVDLIKKLNKVSNIGQRIPLLAKKQVLEECIDILEKYYAVERGKDNG